jgi:hypothetical protein
VTRQGVQLQFPEAQMELGGQPSGGALRHGHILWAGALIHGLFARIIHGVRRRIATLRHD